MSRNAIQLNQGSRRNGLIYNSADKFLVYTCKRRVLRVQYTKSVVNVCVKLCTSNRIYVIRKIN